MPKSRSRKNSEKKKFSTQSQDQFLRNQNMNKGFSVPGENPKQIQQVQIQFSLTPGSME